MTKAELEKSNIEFNTECNRLEANDNQLRKEFAKAFGWFEKTSVYSHDERSPLTPTWSEIFIEVGKLRAARTFYDLEGNVSECECAIEDMNKRLIKIEQK